MADLLVSGMQMPNSVRNWPPPSLATSFLAPPKTVGPNTLWAKFCQDKLGSCRLITALFFKAALWILIRKNF
jgi:hypothetical protein